MHDTKAPPDRDCLLQRAMDQHGYFTTAQARRCGYSGSLISHHARDGGQFVRVRQGLYRFRDFPPSRWQDVMAAWLAAGREHAVVSHETALELLDLTDLIPDAIHITVPRERRWYWAPEGVELHTTTRPPGPNDVVIREGVRVTAPARTIVDVAEAGLAPEHVEEAVRQARGRGLVMRRQLLDAAAERGGSIAAMIRMILGEEESAGAMKYESAGAFRMALEPGPARAGPQPRSIP